MERYAELASKSVSIAYCLFKGVNDSRGDARLLADYVRGLRCKVNLIDFNPISESAFSPVGERRVAEFRSWLVEMGVSALHRKSLGTEIGAGCGQLGGSRVRHENHGDSR
jgi:23S rRNA (adenine2503-C2)-methyltransferase